MRPSPDDRMRWLLPLLLLGGWLMLSEMGRLTAADATNPVVFGPELFQRDQGHPQTSLRQFNLADASGQYNLEILNGDPDDGADFDSQKKVRSASAQVFLNDVQVLAPSDLSKQVRRLTIPVAPQRGQNTLKVVLLGNPVSMLTVSVVRPDTGANPDLVPPRIVAVSPAVGASNVPVSLPHVEVTFSEPIKLDTLSASSFYVSVAGHQVAGKIAASPDATMISFSPASPFAYASTYTVTVTCAVRDAAGNPLAAVFSSTFTTEAAPPPPPPARDLTPPRVAALSPQSGSLDNQNSVAPTVTFSEPINATSARDNLLVFADTAQGSGAVVQDGSNYLVVPNGERIEGAVELSPDGLSATFTPTATSADGTLRPTRLPANALITVVVTARVKDLAGNPLDQNAQLSGPQLFSASFSTSAFNLTASTATARTNSQAARLPVALLSGDSVFISGGYDELNRVNETADVYDASSGAFRTVPMITGRAEHTATVLADGRVLLVGGISSTGQVLASAEIYDPVTGTFSPVGSLHTARFRHTATLLADGSVLVAGGYNAAALDTCEIFFPAGSTFPAINAFVEVTARMSAARAYHSATALQDGSVLLAGGVSNGLVLDSAEVFVPTPFAPQFGQFVAGAGPLALFKMSAPRFRHTATLLPNGQVLIAGGKDGLLRTLATAELFKPASVIALSSFAAAGLMTEARADHSATLLPDGSVLFAGGSSGSQTLQTAEVYRGSRFTALRSRLSEARSSHAAVLLGSGAVLLSNGESNAGALRSAEVYTPRP